MDDFKKRYFEDIIYYEKQRRFVEKEIAKLNKLNKYREKALLNIIQSLKSREFLNIIDDEDISISIIRAKNEMLKLKHYEFKLKCDENRNKKDFQDEALAKFQISEYANKLERKSYMCEFINRFINPNSYKITLIIRDTVLHRIAINEMILFISYCLSKFSNSDDSLSSAHDGLKYLIEIDIQFFNKYKEKIEEETTLIKQEFKTTIYSIDKATSDLDALLEMFSFVKQIAQKHFYRFANANNNNIKMYLYEVEVFFRDILEDDYLNKFKKTKNLGNFMKLNDPVSESESNADSIKSNETNKVNIIIKL
jgi:hypothetical protein